MAHAQATAHPFLHPEYSVYIYHLPENHLDGQSDWERRSVFADSAAAMNEAYRLFKSQNFKKVEVKQRQHNPYTRSVKARTVKVFDPQSNKKAALHWLAAFAGVLGVCIAGCLF
jgi:hypothetical protein